MNYRYGLLESTILNALWALEANGIYKNSVKDVYDYICASKGDNKAYTTIKTVMDRLFKKEILLRVKQGKKFFYRTAYSNSDVIAMSLKKIAAQYCNNDLDKLAQVVQSLKLEVSEFDTKINIG